MFVRFLHGDWGDRFAKISELFGQVCRRPCSPPPPSPAKLIPPSTCAPVLQLAFTYRSLSSPRHCHCHCQCNHSRLLCPLDCHCPHHHLQIIVLALLLLLLHLAANIYNLHWLLLNPRFKMLSLLPSQVTMITMIIVTIIIITVIIITMIIITLTIITMIIITMIIITLIIVTMIITNTVIIIIMTIVIMIIITLIIITMIIIMILIYIYNRHEVPLNPRFEKMALVASYHPQSSAYFIINIFTITIKMIIIMLFQDLPWLSSPDFSILLHLLSVASGPGVALRFHLKLYIICSFLVCFFPSSNNATE